MSDRRSSGSAVSMACEVKITTRGKAHKTRAGKAAGEDSRTHGAVGTDRAGWRRLATKRELTEKMSSLPRFDMVAKSYTSEHHIVTKKGMAATEAGIDVV